MAIKKETKTLKTPAKPKKKASISVAKKKAKPVVQKVAKTKKETIKDKEEMAKKDKRYFEGIGRRKTAVARVRLFTIRPFEGEEGRIIVNDKPYKEYFPSAIWQQIAESSLRRLKSLNRFEISAKVSGGGLHAQAEAIRHGASRALVEFNADFRKKLKRAGFLKRDPRMVERKKFGLKKARRSPQWSKR